MLISLFLILSLVMVSCYLFNKTMIEGNKLNDEVDKSVNSFSVSELEEKNKDEKINEAELSTNDEIDKDDNSTSIATREDDDEFVNENENKTNSNVIIKSKKEEDIDKKENVIDNSNIIEKVEQIENEPRANQEETEIKEDIEVKEKIDNSSDKVDNSSNDTTIIDDTSKSDTKTEELSKEKDIPEVDEEYERLKKLYKYKTGSECYYASLKAYSKTYQENYENAGCISGAYKGELLGYRIIIYYNDGTSMYYDEAI